MFCKVSLVVMKYLEEGGGGRERGGKLILKFWSQACTDRQWQNTPMSNDIGSLSAPTAMSNRMMFIWLSLFSAFDLDHWSLASTIFHGMTGGQKLMMTLFSFRIPPQSTLTQLALIIYNVVTYSFNDTSVKTDLVIEYNIYSSLVLFCL